MISTLRFCSSIAFLFGDIYSTVFREWILLVLLSLFGRLSHQQLLNWILCLFLCFTVTHNRYRLLEPIRRVTLWSLLQNKRRIRVNAGRVDALQLSQLC